MILHHEPVESEKIKFKSSDLNTLKRVNMDHSHNSRYSLLKPRAAVIVI